MDGYPLAFDIFEGDKYEGHTLLGVVLSRISNEEVEVQIFNQSGALVRNFNTVSRQDRINIADLPAGKYTLSMLDGNMIQSIQMVKK